jgi:[ribosomal protein S5]-alanine N-acetyltransferase
MRIFAETERLILRELLPMDDKGMFELDSDPEVHRYLGNNPIHKIEQAQDMIAYVRSQYEENGIGRWAVVDKQTNEFMGWAGLKLVRETTNNMVDFYDVGYRLINRYWGKGYASETMMPSLRYGFETLKIKELYGMVQVGNKASRRIIEKSGLKFIENFDYKSDTCACYKITKQEFEGNSFIKS